MDQLLKLVVKKTGLPEDKAKVAVETVVGFLKKKLHLASQIWGCHQGGNNRYTRCTCVQHLCHLAQADAAYSHHGLCRYSASTGEPVYADHWRRILLTRRCVYRSEADVLNGHRGRSVHLSQGMSG